MIDPAASVADSSPVLPAQVPGVVAVHDPRPPIARALGAVSGALRESSNPDPADGIVVTPGEEITVATAITTSTEARTPDTARAVADALRSRYPEAARITVQVRRIAHA